MEIPSMGMPSQSSQPTPVSMSKPEPSKPLNPWMIASAVLGIALIASLTLGQGGGFGGAVGSQKAADDLVQFINTVYGSRVGTATLGGVTEEHGLYKVNLTVADAQGTPSEQVVFVTRDGKLFIPAAVDVAEVMAQFEEFQKTGGSLADPQAGGDVTAPAPTNTNSAQ